MESLPLEGLWIDMQFIGVTSHVRHGDLRGFLHDVTQLSRECQSFGTVGHARFDEEDVTTGAGYRQAGRHAGHARAVGRFKVEVRTAEPLAHVAGPHVNGGRAFSAASFVAALRNSRPISRSRLRTPASRV